MTDIEIDASVRKPDKQVKVALPQVARHGVEYIGPQRQAQVGEARADLGQQLLQYRRQKVARHADPQRPRSQPRRRQIDDLIVDAEHAPRIIDHELARIGEADTRRTFVEQLAIEKSLEALDLRAHRWLGHPQRIGGSRERSKLYDRNQRSQQFRRYVDHSSRLLNFIVAGLVRISALPRRRSCPWTYCNQL